MGADAYPICLFTLLYDNPNDVGLVVVFARLFNAKGDRPLIKDKEDEDMLVYIENLLKTREVFYNQAHLISDGTVFGVEILKDDFLKLI